MSNSTDSGISEERLLTLVEVFEMLSHKILVFHRYKVTHIRVAKYVVTKDEIIQVLRERDFPLFYDLIIHVFKFLWGKLR